MDLGASKKGKVMTSLALGAESHLLLPSSFYLRDVLTVAKDLIGRYIVTSQVLIKITETEAYGTEGDSASHAHKGKTKRNAMMFQEGGRAYVYLCYGMHWMLNVVTGQKDEPQAVLIRGGELLSGKEVALERRKQAEDLPSQSLARLLAGPGKLGQALGLQKAQNGVFLYESEGLGISFGEEVRPSQILVGPRIGIGYAKQKDQEAPFRFALEGSPGISVQKGLGRKA